MIEHKEAQEYNSKLTSVISEIKSLLLRVNPCEWLQFAFKI